MLRKRVIALYMSAALVANAPAARMCCTNIVVKSIAAAGCQHVYTSYCCVNNTVSRRAYAASLRSTTRMFIVLMHTCAMCILAALLTNCTLYIGLRRATKCLLQH